MLLSFAECMNQYGNQYQIQKQLDNRKLFKLEAGIYSTVPGVSELELIAYKYPNAVFTMDSAFFYHGLTDVIPSSFCLATPKSARPIADKRVKQFYHRKEVFSIGKTIIRQNSVSIPIYDCERMLIELIRNKNNLPFDFYKEVIENYRRRIDRMDIENLQNYLVAFPRQNHIFEAIQLEVF